MTESTLTTREEANALTCLSFRNGFIETLHAGNHSGLFENPPLSRITDPEMKKLMIEASANLAHYLALKDNDPKEYWRQMLWAHDSYTKDKWDTEYEFKPLKLDKTTTFDEMGELERKRAQALNESIK